NCTVNGSMIGGERDLHAVAHDDLAIDYYQCWRNGTNGENSRLRRVNHGSEAIDVEHAQVADGERAAAEILWAQFAFTCRLGQASRLACDVKDAPLICIAQDGDDK